MRYRRVEFELCPARNISDEEIKLILRAADDLIASGGRTLLAKILKGSKGKKLLELKLDKNPSYGCFKSFPLDEVMRKVDWMIAHRYLEIEYNGRLPLIVFSDKGWEIESEERAEEFLREWDTWLDNGVKPASMKYLKDLNRQMILLFLQKVKETGNPKYIPFLKKWEPIDYRKVREEIRRVIRHLEHPRVSQ